MSDNVPRKYGTDTGKPQPPVEHQFKPGNPGRPKGARSKLGEAFLKAMLDDFDKHGVEAVEKVRDERPADYLKVVASILPKELSIDDETLQAMVQVAFVGRRHADDAG